MRRVLSFGLFAALGMLAFSGTARAEDNDLVATAKPGYMVMKDYIIYGKRMHPLVAADVARLPLHLTLNAEKHLLSDRIEEAISRDPF